MTEQSANTSFSSVVEVQVTVLGDLGLHARPAGRLAMAAQPFSCSITLASAVLSVDAKSILDILSLSATKGTVLTLRCEGHDAQEASEVLAALFRANLEESRG